MSTSSESDTIDTCKKVIVYNATKKPVHDRYGENLLEKVIQSLPRYLIDKPLAQLEIERPAKCCLEKLTQGRISTYHQEQKDTLIKLDQEKGEIHITLDALKTDMPDLAGEYETKIKLIHKLE